MRLSCIDFIGGDVCVTVYTQTQATCTGIFAIPIDINLPTFPITIRVDGVTPCVSVEINKPACGP